MAIESSAILHKHKHYDTHAVSERKNNSVDSVQVQENKLPNAPTTTVTAPAPAPGTSGRQQDQHRGQGLASIRCIEIQYLSAMKVSGKLPSDFYDLTITVTCDQTYTNLIPIEVTFLLLSINEIKYLSSNPNVIFPPSPPPQPPLYHHQNKHRITCEPFVADNNRTVGNVYDNKNQVCAQYYCYWTTPTAVKTD